MCLLHEEMAAAALQQDEGREEQGEGVEGSTHARARWGTMCQTIKTRSSMVVPAIQRKLSGGKRGSVARASATSRQNSSDLGLPTAAEQEAKSRLARDRKQTQELEQKQKLEEGRLRQRLASKKHPPPASSPSSGERCSDDDEERSSGEASVAGSNSNSDHTAANASTTRAIALHKRTRRPIKSANF